MYTLQFFFLFFRFYFFIPIICIKKCTIPSKNFFFIASFISFFWFQQIFEQLKYWHTRVLILTTDVLILSIYLLKILIYEWMNVISRRIHKYSGSYSFVIHNRYKYDAYCIWNTIFTNITIHVQTHDWTINKVTRIWRFSSLLMACCSCFLVLLLFLCIAFSRSRSAELNSTFCFTSWTKF